MTIVGIVLGNLIIMAVMLGFALIWNFTAWLRRHKEFQRPIHAYAPSRAEWSAYYWRRARKYMISYGVMLAVLVLLPILFNRRVAGPAQIQSVLSVLPGLIGYFVLGGLIPARFTIYAEGFGCFALIPFLPGQRDHDSKLYSDFRVGLKSWRDYRDAVPRGHVLIIKGERVGAELIIAHGQRDRLLNLAREGLKAAKDERRQQKKTRRDTAR